MSKILVIGDIILDKYMVGSSSKISPEAPVPIVDLSKTFYRLGGAANVAAQIAKLGAETYLMGVIGPSVESAKLMNMLYYARVNTSLICMSSIAKLPVKTRVISDGRQILRVDDEERIVRLDPETQNILTSEELNSFDKIVFSDYDKGTLESILFNTYVTGDAGSLGGLCPVSPDDIMKKVIIDPKPTPGKPSYFYSGAMMMIPNQNEFTQLGRNAKEIIDDYDLEYLLVTGGEKGMKLWNRSGIGGYQTAITVSPVVDTTGAGDVVTACMAYYLAQDVSIHRAMRFAAIAAAVSVGHIGTYLVSQEEINQFDLA